MFMKINEVPITTSNPETTLIDHRKENYKSQVLIDYFIATRKFSNVYCKLLGHEKKHDAFYRFMHGKGFVEFCVKFKDFCEFYQQEKEQISTEALREQTLEIENALLSYKEHSTEWNDLQKRERWRHGFNAAPHLVVEEPAFPHMRNKFPTDDGTISQYHSSIPIMGFFQVLSGVILITASLALTALSYGTLSPMSLYGLSLGITLIMGGALAVGGMYQVGEAVVKHMSTEDQSSRFTTMAI